MSNALPDQLLYTIIRFSNSLQDISLSIESPRTTTTLSLKQLIRQKIPPPHNAARLRLIHSGKVLQDTTSLSKSLNLPPPPLPSSYNENDPKAKGKAPVRNNAVDAKKVYIHCSISDALTTDELWNESSAALASEQALLSSSGSRPTTSGGTRKSADASRRQDGRRGSATTSAQPQGFDRLLQGGFTREDVAQLRTQFMSNLSYQYTPDTMPTGNSLRALEDQWLDRGAHGSGTATNNSASATTTEGEVIALEDNEFGEGPLDDMLIGNIMGFFWPLGALCWGFREEGVWSRRRQVAVFTGVALNLVVGFLRLTNW